MSIEGIIKHFLALFKVPAWGTFVVLFAVFVYRQWRAHLDSSAKSKSEKIERFLEKLPTLPTENRAILIEQLFLDTFGKPISNPEIGFFLKTEKPTEYIRLFLQARAYFDRSANKEILLKNGFSTINKLRFAKWHRIFWYAIFASIGLLLVAYSQSVFALPPAVWAVFVYLVFSLLLMAYLMLDASTDVDAAIKLVQALPDLSKPNNSVTRTPIRLRFLGALRALRSGAGYFKR